MKKAQVTIGSAYLATVSGARTEVRIDCVNPFGGWNGTNLRTGRGVRIRSAQRLSAIPLSRGQLQALLQGRILASRIGAGASLLTTIGRAALAAAKRKKVA